MKNLRRYSRREERHMNEECLLKYLLNPDELEILTEFLENINQELEPIKEPALMS